MATIRFGQRTYRLPASRLIRIPVGILLILFGIVGFLPVVGFWMIPLGLIVLSIDIPVVRRRRRMVTVRLGLWLRERHPSLADKLGFNNNGRSRQT